MTDQQPDQNAKTVGQLKAEVQAENYKSLLGIAIADKSDMQVELYLARERIKELEAQLEGDSSDGAQAEADA